MIIKLVSLVQENGLKLLEVYEGQKLDVLDKTKFISKGKSRYEDEINAYYIKKEGYNIKDLGWFPVNKFITLAEFREKQINTILE
jgi:hypothetical protein